MSDMTYQQMCEVAEAVPESEEPLLCSCGRHYVGVDCVDADCPVIMKKSRGHIKFEAAQVGVTTMTWEFYRFGENIYRAKAAAPVMPDGYRCGRWFSPATPTYLEALDEVDDA